MRNFIKVAKHVYYGVFFFSCRCPSPPRKVPVMEKLMIRSNPRPIGAGGFGSIFAASFARDGPDHEECLVVKVQKARPGSFALAERNVLLALRDSPMFPYLVAAFVDEQNFTYIVMERVCGRDLAAVIREDHAGGRRMDEATARHFMVQVVSAVLYMHRCAIVHRDLKSENVMVSRDDGRVVIVDFGLARKLSEFELFNGIPPYEKGTQVLGTPGFQAPELLAYKSHGLAVDLWGVGNVMTEMFFGPNETLFGKRDPNDESLHEPAMRRLSGIAAGRHCVDFLSSCLAVNPSERLTIEEAACLPFLGSPQPVSALPPPVAPLKTEKELAEQRLQ